MKNKKILSFALALAFTFVTVLGCFSVMSVSASTIELKDEDYANALNALKIICPNFPLSEGEVTTRAEFVAAVTMAMNMPASQSGETGFLDVEANDKYAPNIAYALGLGLISNVDLFYPDSPITYTQAVKIVMCAAGYGPMAEYQGGYPVGYLRAANDADVGRGLNLSDTDNISHADAIRLIFDAVVTDMLEISSFGTNVNYNVTEGKNILSTYHKIFMAEGIVEANENTGITSVNNASGDDVITVDSVNYLGNGYENLLGKNVRVFFEDNKQNTIIYAYECGNTVNEYTEKDVLTISGSSLTVSPDGAAKDIRYSLEADYSFIYNGKFYGSADYNSLINPAAGSVSLLDNDNNNKIDVIIVKDVEYGVIGSVNEFDEKVYDKYKKNGLVDLSDSSVRYMVSEADGTAIALDDLEEDDAVGYAISKDKMLYEIIRYSERVGGTYDSKTSDGMLEIKGEEYQLSDYYMTNVKSIDNIKFGSEVILHLGVGNQVIYVQEFSSSLHYAFVLAAGQETGLDGKAVVKLYSDEGKMLALACSDKFRLDGVSMTSRSAIADALGAIVAKPYAYRVIKYALNAEGELVKVYTATDNTEGTNVIYTQINSESGPVIYYDSTKLVEGGVISDDPTVAVPYEIANNNCPYSVYGSYTPYFHKGPGAVAMQIPVRPADFNDEDKFNISPAVEEEYVRAVAYDVTTGGAASFILVSNDTAGGSINRYTGSSIIESISQGVNEDGEAVTVLKLYSGGAWDKYYYDPDVTKISAENTGGNGTVVQSEIGIEDFGPGDIIRITTNSEKVITEMTRNFDASTKEIPAVLSQTSSNNGRYVEFIAGYALGISTGKQGLIATGMTPEQIVDAQGNIALNNTFSASFTRGTTVFVTLNRNRQTGAVESAVVSTETDLSSVETYFNSGSTMDYIVLRRYFREPSLNAIYVNIDE